MILVVLDVNAKLAMQAKLDFKNTKEIGDKLGLHLQSALNVLPRNAAIGMYSFVRFGYVAYACMAQGARLFCLPFLRWASH